VFFVISESWAGCGWGLELLPVVVLRTVAAQIPPSILPILSDFCYDSVEMAQAFSDV
jgi:hypothetical protein